MHMHVLISSLTLSVDPPSGSGTRVLCSLHIDICKYVCIDPYLYTHIYIYSYIHAYIDKRVLP